MNIKLLGVEGCPNCKKIEMSVYDVLVELDVLAAVEKVTDAAEIISISGTNAVPGLVINGKVKFAGRIPSRAEIKKLINEEVNEQATQ